MSVAEETAELGNPGLAGNEHSLLWFSSWLTSLAE
jgi:hypothetical protein